MARKKLSLRTRAILLVSVFMLVTNLALGAVLLHQVRTATKTQINERMLDVVNTAAAMLDGDVLDALTAGDLGSLSKEYAANSMAPIPDMQSDDIRALDRPDAKRIPIIALTANAFDEDVQRSLQAGMNAHLNKPVDTDRLFQTLGELIFEAESEQQV